jgi:hypothetical protein
VYSSTGSGNAGTEVGFGILSIAHTLENPWLQRKSCGRVRIRGQSQDLLDRRAAPAALAAVLHGLHYYNTVRTHLSLAKDAPILRPVHPIGRIQPRPVVGGLHHQYIRI